MVDFSIEYELCWRVYGRADVQPPFRPLNYRAPTWSWAFVKGMISYEYKRDYDHTGYTHVAFVENVKVETIDGTATGLVKSVSMHISGPLRASSSHDFYSDDPAQAIPDKIFYLTMFGLYCDMSVWDLAFSRLEMGPDKGCYERISTFDFSDERLLRLLESIGNIDYCYLMIISQIED